jgi:hypothetical protein
MPWIILAVIWAAAAYQAWGAYRKGKLAEPANPVAAIATRVRVALSYAIAIGILALGGTASLAIASAEQNRWASYAALGTLGAVLLGGFVLWKWFWRRRRL